MSHKLWRHSKWHNKFKAWKVYHQKSDAVRFQRTLNDPPPKFVSSPSVQRWRESANENLEKLKSKIEEIPDVVDEVFTGTD